MSAESFEYTDRLSRLTDEKLEVLTRMRELAHLQIQQTAGADAQVLVAMLARKQPLVDALARIQSEMEVYVHDDPEARLWPDPAEREKCRANSHRCKQLLQEILLLEQRSLDELSATRDAVAVQLQDGRDGMVARAAYSLTSVNDEGSLDLSSS